MDPISHRVRRSALYLPASNGRALAKARTLAADCILIDLEDAVAPEAKTAARDAVAQALAEGAFGPRERVVRINGLSTPWGKEDLACALAARPDAILLPKVTSANDVMQVAALLGDSPVRLWAMIEMPLAILHLEEIAACARQARLDVFVMGTNDLAKEMRAELTGQREALLPALSLSVMAARAFGIDILDGVYNDLSDEAGFASACAQGVAMGFDGKTLIHPGQIAQCNLAFSPRPQAIAHAQAVIDAFALPENAGRGVIKVDGQMTELLHLEQAKRLVTIGQAIAARQQEISD